jgi:histidinol-phosphate aminotransferase
MSIRPRKSILNPALHRPSALDSIPRDRDALWLDKNENLDPELLMISQQVLASVSPNAISTYPELGELYRRLAKWVDVTPDSLLITAGSDGVIRSVFEAFIEQGDGVAHTLPTFAMYPVYSQMFGANTTTLEYVRSNDGPHLDLKLVLEVLHVQKPKILCLPNPDSPTGTVFSAEALLEILSACEASETLLLLDEAYHPFYEWSGVPWTQRSRNLIVARTFAKAWGAAGMRIGYAVGHPETIALLHKMRPMYEMSTIAVEFIAKMLDFINAMESSVARIQEGKIFFSREMASLGFKVFPAESNFIHIAFGERANDIHLALEEGKVLYRKSFEHPSLAGFSRFTVATKSEMIKVINLIKKAVGNYP